MIQIDIYGGEGESGIAFESGGIKGIRYGNWQGEKSILCELTDKRGKCRFRSTKKEFQLKGIKEGFYTLTVEILLNGTGIVKKSFSIKVQKSPF